MTAIAAIAEKGKVWVGGDSAGTSSYSLTIRKDEKVFIKGKFIMGFTSSYRMGQLLHYSFVPPKHPKKLTDVEYMNTLFINSIRKCFKDGGFAENTNGQESGGTFIVGYKGNIYYIYGDYQVGIPLDNFASVGCGDHICLGSLCSTTGKPEQRITTALTAAERYSSGVRGPFLIMSL